MRKLLFCAVFIAGCATTSSRQPAVHYSGEPFDLAQHGSHITGQVCGMDVTVDVTRRTADSVALEGFLDGRFPVHITARPDPVGRSFQGALGTQAGNSAVDLRLGSGGLDGRVGWRQFDLKPRGDDLAGSMQIAGSIEPSEAVLQGRSELASMPLEAQAALVPALLSCNVQKVGNWGRSSLTVRVGGPAGALPHQSSSVYTRD